MNEFLDPLLRNLNDCDCCEGISQATPIRVVNRAGLSAIAYRVGIHSQFKQSLLAALSDSKLPALQGLTTREDEDFAIAFLDAWATVADVLTFYQERIANESYLRTATERLSLLELARLIGYELRPGVAASTYLAFTLEDAPGAPGYATIETGTKVQSIPGPGEQAQTFETVAAFAAQAEWNQIKPRRTEPHLLTFGSTIAYLQGTALGLKAGDGLLFIGTERETNPASERWDFRPIKTVQVNQTAGYTIVTWSQGLDSVLPPAQPAAQPKIYALRQRASLFGHNAPDWRSLPNQTRAGFLPSGAGDYVNRDSEWFNFSLSGDTPGLYGEYYWGTNFSTLRMTRTDATINFAWTDRSPDPLLPVDDFSVRWTGRITPDYSETYTFYTRSDDGVRLWVNNQLIINNWTNHPPTTDTGTIALTAGQKYSLRLEYYERGGSATIALSWSSPRQSYEVIPQSHLSTPPTASFPTETIYLDAVYPQIVQTSWVVLSRPGWVEVYQVAAVAEASRTDFTLSSKTTRLKLQGEDLYTRFNQHLRDTVVFAQSEALIPAERPLISAIAGSPSQFVNRVSGTLTPVEGKQIQLDHAIPGLTVGQRLIVSGRRSRARIAATVAPNSLKLVSLDGSDSIGLNSGDSLQTLKSPKRTATGTVQWQLKTQTGFAGTITTNLNQILLDVSQVEDETVSEGVAIAAISDDQKTLQLATGLTHSYDLATVTIYGNVVPATHGETKAEVLGSGDASQPYQAFTLRQSPLTYVSAQTPSGAESTLKVRVNEVLWHEVAALYGTTPRDRVFTTRIGDDGKTTIQFGDGKTGARLPTGQENVTATYRKGIGLEGLVKANQLSLLMTRALGVKGVINPLPATGAEDPETLEQARQNAPLTVLTLERIVSLQDYEDFARTFAGIAKALATWTWNGQSRGVFVTIAGPNGAAVPASSDIYKNLIASLRKFSDPYVPLRVQSYRPAWFRFKANVRVHPDYMPERVLTNLEQTLRSRFSFDQRAFGQPVVLSDVVATMQSVAGIVAVDVDQLYRQDEPPTLRDRLIAQAPRPGDNQIVLAAELLLLSPTPLNIQIISTG